MSVNRKVGLAVVWAVCLLVFVNNLGIATQMVKFADDGSIRDLPIVMIFPALLSLMVAVGYTSAVITNKDSVLKKAFAYVFSDMDKAIGKTDFLERGPKIVFAGISIALSSLMVLVCFTYPDPAVRAIAVLGCAMVYLVSLDSLFKDRGFFAFCAMPSIVSVVSVILTALYLGASSAFLIPLGLYATVASIGFLIAFVILRDIVNLILDAVGARSEGNTDDPFRVELPEPLDSIRNWLLFKVFRKTPVVAAPLPAE